MLWSKYKWKLESIKNVFPRIDSAVSFNLWEPFFNLLLWQIDAISHASFKSALSSIEFPWKIQVQVSAKP